MSCDVINILGIEYYVLCNICKEPTVSIGHTGLTWGRSYFRTILQPLRSIEKMKDLKTALG